MLLEPVVTSTLPHWQDDTFCPRQPTVDKCLVLRHGSTDAAAAAAAAAVTTTAVLDAVPVGYCVAVLASFWTSVVHACVILARWLSCSTTAASVTLQIGAHALHRARHFLCTRLVIYTRHKQLYRAHQHLHTDSLLMMMMMMRRFVERVLNSPQTRCPSQSNRWDLRCRANARG